MVSKAELELLCVKEVALKLRCSEQSVRRRINEGSLPAVKLGDGPRAVIRVDRRELEQWIYGASPAEGAFPPFTPPHHRDGAPAGFASATMGEPAERHPGGAA
jgi:excisionase family DNA binding protein